MAVVGYARVSTHNQKLDAQLDQLHGAGVEKIFEEKASGVDANREELAKMLDWVREGDTVICCKLDRIARSTQHLLEIVDRLEKKGVAFRVLNINLDTSTPTGKLMLTMLAGIATFERDMMLERQREGIAKAKERGAYKGRKPTARMKTEDVLLLVAEGKKKVDVARELGIGIASVHRIIAAGRRAVVGDIAKYDSKC
ncbi:integrative genetic element Gsu5, resolvase [Citrifermentans bremense]|uniref:Integrative genetic element Gsu5, resolvase n=1 Tax=Citrifermentans bremense TaxID=60035 RepID=A0A6S6LZR9_9BACT|nr:recombinase family protein [Citrifermentans bremense]BCG46808.1 integrative genetic element Gsu5, resolvase [Citrifermentans bremense]